jgi:hypothetical protein
VIVARVLYALLISVSLVMNLLLVIAVLRCRAKVSVILPSLLMGTVK